MATIVNNRSTLETDPIRNFRFLVNFITHDPSTNKDLTSGSIGFTSVSGLAVTTDSIPYREGGYNTTVHQIPGQTSFTPITLQRGVVLGTKQNWEWMRQLFATVQANGTNRALSQNFRCDLEIQVLSHPIPNTTNSLTPDVSKDHVAMRFKVYNAWPTTVAYSDLNAGDNALFVEQMTLVHEGFDLNWGLTIDATGTAPSFDEPVTPPTTTNNGNRADQRSA
jgi:phage tail-like protein